MQTINIYRSSTLGLETLTFILKTKLYAELAALESLPKKMKFSIKDFFSKCDQIRRKLRICSHLLNKSLMKSFFFCALELFIDMKLTNNNTSYWSSDLNETWENVNIFCLTLAH